MNPPRRLRGTFGMCNLREGFVNLHEGLPGALEAPRSLLEDTLREGFAKAPRAPSFGNDSSDSDKPPGGLLCLVCLLILRWSAVF